MLLLVALALMQDSVVTGYLEQLCGKLGSHPEVTLAEDPAPRATALPNGSVRVTNGMVAGAATEAELAGILAHELAHLQLARESPGARDGRGNRALLSLCTFRAEVPRREAVGTRCGSGRHRDTDEIRLRSPRHAPIFFQTEARLNPVTPRLFSRGRSD